MSPIEAQAEVIAAVAREYEFNIQYDSLPEATQAVMRAFDTYLSVLPCGCEASLLVRRKVFTFGLARGGMPLAHDLLRQLKDYGDYCGFAWAGMFLGVEKKDGYIHS